MAVNLNSKSLLIFVSLLALFIIWIWPKGIKIREVPDGSTVILSNGSTIRLIGVSSSKEGQSELSSLKGKVVVLQPDSSNPFEPERMEPDQTYYAYVLLKSNHYECLNATLLKKGQALLVENTYLTDSLSAFRVYADRGRGKGNPEPYYKEINYEEEDFDLPVIPDPSLLRSERRYQYWSSDWASNVGLLEEACDYNLPYTKQFANRLAAEDPGVFSPEQICDVFDYCYNKWRYVNDPSGQEYLSKASETIYGSLVGDCDDFAILMASCILAIGGNASIVVAFNANSGHAYAEVDIASFDESYVRNTIKNRFSGYNHAFNVRSDGQHQWLNMDWQSSYPGGKYYSSTRRYIYSCVSGNWTYQP